MSEQNERSFLEERKAECLAELRRREPELVAKFLMLTELIEEFDSTEEAAAIEASSPAEPTEEAAPEKAAAIEGAKIHKPLEAMATYLDKTGKPTPRGVVAKSLANAGWGKGWVVNPYQNLLSMLIYHFGPRYKSKPLFKEINGLLGRVGWPDEAFTQAVSEEETEGPLTQKERPAPKD